MRPLRGLSGEEARGLVGLLFDLDDTLLTHGVLERGAYAALWDLHRAGIELVAVTGRPSGWAEVFVRQWPIAGAVSENGAIFVVRDGHGVSILADGTTDEVASRRAKLGALVETVRATMPELRLADDCHARRSDVTWDIGEKVTVPEEQIRALGALVVASGARTTRSTVHLHASFERDDKASGAVRFLCERFGEDAGAALHRWAFVGDSGNDAACFSAFRTTFGVANVRRFVSGPTASLTVPPRWVASSERGAGFAEIARALLAARW